jgi:hemerythrin superfamily protein
MAKNDNIYEALRESHELQRSLCRRLLRTKPDGRRKEILRELRIELAAHAAAEERFLYAPILMHDMGLNSARHALAEHHEIDECVEDVSKADFEGGSWYAKAKKLSHEVHHHLREEETKFFQVSGKILTDTQKKKLAKQYESDYRRMRTSLAQ